MIKLVIADDHQIVIDGLRHMLQAEDDIVIIGEASHGGELLALLSDTHADVVLLDIDMPVMNGIAACKAIVKNHRGTRIVVLTMMQEASVIRKMLGAGASGYLMKNTGKVELIKAIKAVFNGGTYYSEDVAKTILSDLSGTTRDALKGGFPSLSRREKQILQLIVDEMTTGEIALELNIAFGTVETHRRNMMQKLGVKNVVGLVRLAIENGLLD
jgi:DNA-binding NarL/FixJ family response regulator